MKLQKNTLILITSALILGGFVYFYEIQGAAQRAAVKTAQQKLFQFEEKQVQRITLITPQESLKFARISQTAPSWILETTTPNNSNCTTLEAKPEPQKPALCEAPSPSKGLINSSSMIEQKIPASDAAIAYLLSTVTSAKFDRKITMTNPEKQRQEYGLDTPKATVEFVLANQTRQRLILGKPDFNKSFLYAQINPPEDRAKALEVVLVPIDLENAISRPAAEWKNQPTK